MSTTGLSNWRTEGSHRQVKHFFQVCGEHQLINQMLSLSIIVLENVWQNCSKRKKKSKPLFVLFLEGRDYYLRKFYLQFCYRFFFEIADILLDSFSVLAFQLFRSLFHFLPWKISADATVSMKNALMFLAEIVQEHIAKIKYRSSVRIEFKNQD